jgi:muramoyltetrapeptide carboxypeptidase LdcA involved in peptidoglycan recycling
MIKNKGMRTINEGEAEGIILGGNLCTFNLLQGTEFMPDINESILFLEDDDLSGDAYMQEFDRNLESIIQLPNFSNVKGIVIGRAQSKCNMNFNKWKK